MLAEDIYFEIGHFLHLSDLRDFDLGSGHMAYCRLSYTKFGSNCKIFLWTDRHWDWLV